MNRALAFVTLASAVVVLFAGGCDVVSYFGYTEDYETLRATTWQLVSFDGYDEEVQTAESTLFLNPDAKTFGGGAACNTYGGRYDVEGHTLTLDVRWRSQVACPLNEYEDTLMATLNRVESYDIDRDTLVLYTSQTENLHFEVQSEE